MKRMNLHRLREQIKQTRQIAEQQYAMFAQKQQSRSKYDVAYCDKCDGFIKRAKDKPSTDRMG